MVKIAAAFLAIILFAILIAGNARCAMDADELMKQPSEQRR